MKHVEKFITLPLEISRFEKIWIYFIISYHSINVTIFLPNNDVFKIVEEDPECPESTLTVYSDKATISDLDIMVSRLGIKIPLSHESVFSKLVDKPKGMTLEE